MPWFNGPKSATGGWPAWTQPAKAAIASSVLVVVMVLSSFFGFVDFCFVSWTIPPSVRRQYRLSKSANIKNQRTGDMSHRNMRPVLPL